MKIALLGVVATVLALAACQRVSNDTPALSKLQHEGYTSVQLYDVRTRTTESSSGDQAQINKICHMPAGTNASEVDVFTSDQKSGIICTVGDKAYII